MIQIVQISELPQELIVQVAKFLALIDHPSKVSQYVRQFRVRQASQGKTLLELGVLTWMISFDLDDATRRNMDSMFKAIISGLKGQTRTGPPPPGHVERELKKYLNSTVVVD